LGSSATAIKESEGLKFNQYMWPLFAYGIFVVKHFKDADVESRKETSC